MRVMSLYYLGNCAIQETFIIIPGERQTDRQNKLLSAWLIIIIINNKNIIKKTTHFCIAPFFGVHKLTAL